MSNRVSIALAMKLTQSIDKLSKSSEYRKWAALLKAIFMGHKGATGNLTVWDRVFAEDAANQDRDSQAFAGLIINQSIGITASALLLEIDTSEQSTSRATWRRTGKLEIISLHPFKRRQLCRRWKCIALPTIPWPLL